MDTDKINKTIVVSYDDITRMIEFCCDDNGVTKGFMDWYVNENAFFSKTGIFIMEDIINPKTPEGKGKFAISFNFNNPDFPEFVMYEYITQRPILKCSFSKYDNLSMNDISINVKYSDFKSVKNVFVNAKLLRDIKKNSDDITRSLKHNGSRQSKTNKKINKISFEKGSLMTLNFMAKKSIYFCYVMMYYFSKNKSEEIIGVPKSQLLQDGMEEQITTIYKYSGYINLNKETKIYKPIIKKDKNEPIREYGRHIEKWSVRGHYRKVNGKTIWIEPHEKGEGELEKRIYGTEKESEVNVLPKVFEVTRNVLRNDDIVPEKSLNAPVDGVPKLTYIFDKNTENTKEIIEEKKPKYKKISFFNKLFSFFKRITKRNIN